MRIYVFGAGKAGRALHRALKRGGATVTLRARRRGFPKRAPKADLVILAVRDGQLEALATELSDRRLKNVVHCAGALGPDVLDALRAGGAAVGQLHPLVSLAADGEMGGAFACVTGDAPAVQAARRAAKLAGMRAFSPEELDRTLYHACAALLANGGAALAAAAADGFVRAGCAPEDAPAMLGALLVSVGRNLQTVGLPEALTGPVRRGHAEGIRAHLKTLRDRAPHLVELYKALAMAQLPLARELGEAALEDFDAIEDALEQSLRKRA